MTYEKFIDQKTTAALHTDSIQLDADSLNPKLYRFQRDIVRWALAKGRAAIFADCGLGKTPMQLEWAYRVIKERGGMVLILAPLAVAAQTVSEDYRMIPFAGAQTMRTVTYVRRDELMEDLFCLLM